MVVNYLQMLLIDVTIYPFYYLQGENLTFEVIIKKEKTIIIVTGG